MRVVSLFSLALLVLLSQPANAHTIDTTSHVTAATVFADRAIVTRTATLHIPAGAHMISVTDMPAGLNDSTLRVQGKSAAAVKIGSVEVKHVYLKDIAGAAEREKAAAIEAKSDEKSFLEGEIRSLEARRDFANRLAAHATDDAEINGAKSDFTIEKWGQALNLVQTDIAGTEKNLITKQIALRKLDNDIARLQAELNQVRSTGAKEQREAHINYESTEDADLELALTYQTAGASWQPVYDARLDTGSGDLQLEQYGQVAQQTGEDWSDIDLTLSTAQPARGSEMPRIQEWFVRVYQQMENYARREMANVGFAAKLKVMDLEKEQTAMPAAASAQDALSTNIPQLQEAVQENASVQTTEYAAEFHVPGHVALKSINDYSKMFIGKLSMKAELAAQTSPRLAPQAYLFAKITNGETYPLIPGAVAKYRDGAFIGNAGLALLRSGETANLSFGVDDRVKVSYKQIKDEHSNPALVVMGDATVERHYQTKVQNLHKNPITITVFEHYPVAGDGDIDVKLLDDVTTQGFAKDTENRQGVITWSAQYQPKDEKTFVLGFRVKYPKNRQVMGL